MTVNKLELLDYYLETNPTPTLEVCGQKFGVTRERIRQILKNNGVVASSIIFKSCVVEGCVNPVSTHNKHKTCFYHTRRRYLGYADWPNQPRPLPKHGTTTRYGGKYKCRCELCRKANTARIKDIVKRRYAERDENGVHPRASHGSNNGHTNYGCRCELCRKAFIAYNKPYRQAYDRRRRNDK